MASPDDGRHSGGNISSAKKLCAMKPVPALWYPAGSISRKLEISLRRLRLSHTTFTCAYLLTEQPQLLCRFCEALTVQHVLLECTFHVPLRESLHFPTTTPGCTFTRQFFGPYKRFWKTFAYLPNISIVPPAVVAVLDM